METRNASPRFRSRPERSWCSFRRKWLLPLLVLPFAFPAHGASAQAIPSLVIRSDLSVFGLIPANLTPTFAPLDSSLLLGYALGGFYQSPHIIGIEIRGSIQRRLNAQHQESALIGPRVALRFGRVKPYTSILFGAGNGWRYKDPPSSGKRLPRPVEGMGAQCTLSGGVDVQISRRFAVRVGEISYSELYLKRWNLTPVNVTAGVIWRLK